jgi:biotin carboxyl carrier protein
MDSKAKSTGKKKQQAPLEQLEIGGALYETRLTNKFRNRENWQRPDVRMVKAFIPGTVQRIMVQEGEEVSPGTPLLILEAMKMRNEVVSQIQGIIKKIHVAEGDQVPKAHLLLEFT